MTKIFDQTTLDLLTIFAISLTGCFGQIYHSERILHEKLLVNYNKFTRPVKDARQAVDVRVKLVLLKVIEVDEKQQILTTNVMIEQEWHDEYLTWNNTDNLDFLIIPSNKVWTPDIVITNALGDTVDVIGLFTDKAENLVVYDTGKSIRYNSIYLKTFCSMNMARFPFDEHECTIVAGSWVHSNSQLNITVGQDPFEMSDWNGPVSKQWQITELFTDVKFKYYGHLIFQSVHFTIGLQRKSRFFVINLMTPCYLLSILSSVAFILPPESGERLSLGVTTFLSYTVFGLVVTEMVPEESNGTPLFSAFLIATMAINLTQILWTAIVVNVYNASNIPYPCPIKLLMLFEKITFTKMRPSPQPSTEMDDSSEDLKITSDSIVDLKERSYYGGGNSTKINSLVRSRSKVDVLPEVKDKNYRMEWRFITRAIDKTFFILNAVFFNLAMFGLYLMYRKFY